MRIRLLTITHKIPQWLQTGYQDYAKRFPASPVLELIEIPAEKRGPNADIDRITEREGKKMLSYIKAEDHVIALTITGNMWSTETLAQQMQHWQMQGRDVDLLVGGPEGLASACLKRADECWSLSALTFPHFIVRLILVEQLYRALSILQNHPYHR